MPGHPSGRTGGLAHGQGHRPCHEPATLQTRGPAPATVGKAVQPVGLHLPGAARNLAYSTLPLALWALVIPIPIFISLRALSLCPRAPPTACLPPCSPCCRDTHQNPTNTQTNAPFSMTAGVGTRSRRPIFHPSPHCSKRHVRPKAPTTPLGTHHP